MIQWQTAKDEIDLSHVFRIEEDDDGSATIIRNSTDEEVSSHEDYERAYRSLQFRLEGILRKINNK